MILLKHNNNNNNLGIGMDADIHKVKTHVWTGNKLKTSEQFFPTFEEALTFALMSECHMAKVYDDAGDIVVVVTSDENTKHSYVAD